MPHISGKEWEYVKECLDTGWVSSVGSYVTRFEKMIADYVGAKHGIATTSGTAALHIALQVAGVEPDDEVIVSSTDVHRTGKRSPILRCMAGLHRCRTAVLADGSAAS